MWEARYAPQVNQNASNSNTKRMSVMSLQDKAKAAAKNVEGKVQEAVGDLTGNHEAQAKGKAKQAQAKVTQNGRRTEG
jgi:uncharacterized protein YjbJ (UPF0337 family)